MRCGRGSSSERSPKYPMDLATQIPFTEVMMLAQTNSVLRGAVGTRDANLAQPWDVCGGALVVVQPEWNGWRTALAKLVDLEQVHWLQPSGAPRRIIHAYVPCSKLQSGNIVHECHQPSAPHRLLVCILKCHTAQTIFEALSRAADERERNPLPKV